MQGRKFEEIAAEVGVSPTRCKDDYHAALEAARPQIARAAHGEITADFERLRTLAMRAAEEGSAEGIRTAALVLERAARFHGLLDGRGNTRLPAEAAAVPMSTLLDELADLT